MSYACHNASVDETAHVFGNVKLHHNVKVKDKAIVAGNIKAYDNAVMRDKVRVSGEIILAGDADVHGEAILTGKGYIQGEADIESSDHFINLIYKGHAITAYRSRKEDQFEINIDGIETNLVEIACVFGEPLADFFDHAFNWREKE